MLSELQLFGWLEEIGHKDKEVDENLIARSFDFKVLEEYIDPENFESFIDDIFSRYSLKATAAGSIEFGANLKDG